MRGHVAVGSGRPAIGGDALVEMAPELAVALGMKAIDGCVLDDDGPLPMASVEECASQRPVDRSVREMRRRRGLWIDTVAPWQRPQAA